MIFSETEKRWLKSLGVPQGMIYAWEKGKAGIGKRYAQAVSTVSGKTLNEVLYPGKEYPEGSNVSDNGIPSSIPSPRDEEMRLLSEEGLSLIHI